MSLHPEELRGMYGRQHRRAMPVDVERAGRLLELASLSQNRQEACSYSGECEYFNPNSAKCYKPRCIRCSFNIGMGIQKILIECGEEEGRGMLEGEFD